MNDPTGQRGFTLVELIVAITVTVLVAGSTVEILRSTAAARRHVDRLSATQQTARMAISAVATALQNACRADGDQAAFEGIDWQTGQMPTDRARFFAISNKIVRPGQGESDVMEYEFFLSRPTAQSPPSLMRRIDPTRNTPPDGGGILEVVAEGVTGMDLTYHDGVEWLTEWPEDRQGWPIAVRICLTVLVTSPDSPAESQWSQRLWPVSRIVNFPHRPEPQRPNIQQENNESAPS